MSDDLGGRGGEPVPADELLADPGFLVTADPERVMALLGLASAPAGRLAAAVYRASAHAHRDAGAADRRQILAVDAARYGDRGLSDRIAAVGLPDVPAVRWRVDWATGSGVHPGFLGFLDGSDGSRLPPVVAVDGRPATVTRTDDAVLLRDPATGAEVARGLFAGSVRGQETTVVVDGRKEKISCDGPDGLPRIFEPSTGEPLGVLPAGGNGGPAMYYYLDAVTSDGRSYVLAGDEKRVAVWDLATRELVGELESEGDDLLSWTVVAIGGRPHAVTGGFHGTVEVWNLATCERIGAGRGEDRELRLMAAATIDGRPHVLARGCNPYVGTPLDTVSVWSVDPLRQIDRLPAEAEKVETATVGDRCLAVTDDGRVWELSRSAPVGNRAPGHDAAVSAVTAAVLDGRPVAVTGSQDETLRIWDLATGRPVGPPLSAETDEYDGVTQVRTALVDGRPYAVTGHDSGYDEYERVWDLAAGREVTDDDRAAELIEPPTGDDLFVPSVTVNGRACAVTFLPDTDPAIRFRDLETGEEIEDTVFRPAGRVTAFATGRVGGHPVAVVASLRRVRVWELTGERAAVADELVFPQTVGAVAVSPEGRLLVGFGNDLAVLSRC
ncbi:WD40 repeat domain-containing protein [Streptomyces sp. NPDC003691]